MPDVHAIKALLLSALAFVFTLAWTPLLTSFLYRHRLGKQIRNDGSTPIFSGLHAHKSGTPTMGGLLIWVTTLIFAVAFFYLERYTAWRIFDSLNFLSRRETLLPLGCLVASALVGLIDDLLDTWKMGHNNRGLSFRQRFLIYGVIACVGAWWFYFKLDWDVVHLPFLGDYSLGWPYILVFIAVVVGTAFSVNQTDGLDGLAGGVLLTSFASYAAIAFVLEKYDLAAFCGVIVGALLAFLWFNINPARFFMGETGSISLGVTLALVALYTNTIFILAIVGLIFVLEALSTIVQIMAKRITGKKVFLSAPIHNHLQAMGWSEPKVVMRFWVIAGVTAVLGLVVFLLDQTAILTSF